MRLLILDDDLGFLFWLAKVLEPCGYSIVPADTVSQAARLIRKLKLSIDLLMVNPAVESAAAFCENLRGRNPNLRVIALAPAGQSETEAAGIPADAIRAKPDLSAVTNLQDAAALEPIQAEWAAFVRQVLGKTNAAGSSRAN